MLAALATISLTVCLGPTDADPAGCTAREHNQCDHGEQAAVIRGAVSEEQLQMLAHLAERVKLNGPAHLVRQTRNFGDNAKNNGGHNVTYLHESVQARETQLLWQLALAADATMPQWGIAKKFQDPSWKKASRPMPTLRCLEAMDYFPGDRVEDIEDSLGWHNDGSTIYTIAIGLTSAGIDYDGGDLQVRTPGSEVQTVSDLQRGDMVAWRGWDIHRVRPVIRGQRQVIVAEWWLGPPASKGDTRPGDTLQIVRNTLQVGKHSGILNRMLAYFAMQTGDQQELAKAAEAANRAVELDPTDAKSHRILGMIKQSQGKIEDAVSAFSKSLKIDPTDSSSHVTVGLFLLDRGEVDAAENHAKQALLHAPEMSRALLLMGFVNKHRNDMKAAAKSFRAVLKIDPKNKVAYKQIGECLFHLGVSALASGDEDTAEKRLGQAIKIKSNPKLSEAHRALGTLFANKGDLQAAEKNLLQALKLSSAGPGAVASYEALAIVLKKKGDDKGSRESLRIARKLATSG
eukprot:TRINITY_DN46961_c0_g1_i1.p1 TRINITY_DN46961_c0_g1~~TRINITY_DN46961_c0_g1_i1.p1  ORF type:complete len:516 (+),score=93.75 TRINITY_DN46961_c0_g1_i1:59-1606(+)